MEALLVGMVTFGALFGGSCLGMYLSGKLKEQHLSPATQDAVKLGVGMIAAMASLVLGLMTASVKGNFDSASKDLQQYATYLIMLDNSLRQYGPEAAEARTDLRDYTRYALHQTWPDSGGSGKSVLGNHTSSEWLTSVETAIRKLQPANANQTDLQSEALSRYRSLESLRWTVVEESVTAIPPIFTVVLVVWLTLIFLSFGLFAPVNMVSVVALFLCAVSLAGAIFLILEMSQPFDGIIAVSPRAIQQALDQLEQ